MECGLETMTVSGCRSAMNFAALSNASMVDWIRVAHFGKDEGRMGDLYCAENCHGENSFLPYRYSIDGTGCLSGRVPIFIVRTHACNKVTLPNGVTIYPDYYYTAKYAVWHL